MLWGAQATACFWGRREDSLWDQVPSFHLVGPRESGQVVKLDGEPSMQSHFSQFKFHRFSLD